MKVTELSYRERIARLRELKLEQTRAKIAKFGARDADDHGTVVPPADFHWEPRANHADGSFYGPMGWATNFRSLMEAYPTYVEPLDAMAGRMMVYLISYQRHNWRPEFDYSPLHAEQARYGLVHGIGGPHHFAPDPLIGLSLGWGGLLQKIRQQRAAHGPEQEEFYQAEEDVVLGVQAWMRHTLDAIAVRAAQETHPDLQENLREMAETNAWLVEHPPRTLREACQWWAWYNMAARIYNGHGAGGQLDQVLLPYYERDLAAGIIDDEQAIYYLACLLLNDAQYYQLGGPAPDGRDTTNRLSYLALEAGHRLGIPCNLTVRVHDRMDEAFYHTAVAYLFNDRLAWPRFCGDHALVEGFMRNGYPIELARQRIAVGCHWMALPGREYTLNDVVKINIAQVFHVAFEEMMGDTKTQPGMQALWERFVDHLSRAVACIAKGLDFHLAHQQDVNPELMLNLLCHGPLERGCDASHGGVEYYNMCVDGAGLATVADSFAALEQRIEREGVLTWQEAAEHLHHDFAGVAGERVRLMLRHSARFGQGNSRGDAWAQQITARYTELVTAERTPGGRIMIPGWFTWSNTVAMGRGLPATPNGRHAGAPISHGANPDPGFRRDGAPTAMVRAIAAVQPGYGNTAPLQLELDPGLLQGEEGISVLSSLLRTHFDLGGTLANVNIINKQKLLDAYDHPERYPDLVVRVTGFTAYFASLSPTFRKLVIDRILEIESV
jgi:pyruvate-formate lyase